MEAVIHQNLINQNTVPCQSKKYNTVYRMQEEGRPYDERTSERASERTNERTNRFKQRNERTNERTSERTNEQDKQTIERASERMMNRKRRTQMRERILFALPVSVVNMIPDPAARQQTVAMQRRT